MNKNVEPLYICPECKLYANPSRLKQPDKLCPHPLKEYTPLMRCGSCYTTVLGPFCCSVPVHRWYGIELRESGAWGPMTPVDNCKNCQRTLEEHVGDQRQCLFNPTHFEKWPYSPE